MTPFVAARPAIIKMASFAASTPKVKIVVGKNGSGPSGPLEPEAPNCEYPHVGIS